MDSRLYEKGQELLEAKLAQHAAMGVLEELPSKDEAKVEEMHRRDAAMHPPQKKPQTGSHHSGALAFPRTHNTCSHEVTTDTCTWGDEQGHS